MTAIISTRRGHSENYYECQYKVGLQISFKEHEFFKTVSESYIQVISSFFVSYFAFHQVFSFVGEAAVNGFSETSEN